MIGYPDRLEDQIYPEGYEVTRVHRGGLRVPDCVCDIFSSSPSLSIDVLAKGPFHIIDIVGEPRLLSPYRYSVGVYQSKVRYQNLQNAFRKLKKILHPDGIIYFDQNLRYEIRTDLTEITPRYLDTLLLPKELVLTHRWDPLYITHSKLARGAVFSLMERISNQITPLGFHPIDFYDKQNQLQESLSTYLDVQLYQENRKLYGAQKS